MRYTSDKRWLRTPSSEAISSISAAIIIGSGCWLLIFVGVFAGLQGLAPRQGEQQTVPESRLQWPERYSKYAFDKRRIKNGALPAGGDIAATHGAVTPISMSPADAMPFVGGSD